jgi:hemoglobin/transferrin/lactoferrin receptor protein
VTLKLAHERKGLWGAELTVVAQERQKRPYADGLYIPAGYVAADLSAWWDISKQWQLLAAVHNIGDRKVVLWSDVRGTASTSTLTDAYTQPGRNFSASLRYNF